MRKPTLLEQAKKIEGKTDGRITDEHIDLAIAWAKEEITFTQASSVIDTKNSNKTYVVLARALRVYIQRELNNRQNKKS